VGDVSASVPAGSHVEQAYLFSSKIFGASANIPDVTIGGTTYSGAQWTGLGVVNGLQAYRTDVTAQMQTAIGGGGALPFNFSVTENTDNGGTDGEVLAVVYSNPAETERTIALLDGFSSQSGDSVTINFSSPLAHVGDPGFESQLSLGIGYSYQEFGGNQRSIIDGNGRRLTSSAGGEDDGTHANGGLITVGGLGDSTANPDPLAAPVNERTDDELYDLGQGNSANPAPFLSNGLNSYTFVTSNPSFDDNIFLLGVNITAQSGVNKPPPGVPDAGSTASLLGLGLLGLLAAKKRIAR
jgi:hypothetical protein